MSDNIFYTILLPILNSSEIEVTEWIIEYYLDKLALNLDVQPTFLQLVRHENCEISNKIF
jgi:hypothetical protein